MGKDGSGSKDAVRGRTAAAASTPREGHTSPATRGAVVASAVTGDGSGGSEEDGAAKREPDTNSYKQGSRVRVIGLKKKGHNDKEGVLGKWDSVTGR